MANSSGRAHALPSARPSSHPTSDMDADTSVTGRTQQIVWQNSFPKNFHELDPPLQDFPPLTGDQSILSSNAIPPMHGRESGPRGFDSMSALSGSTALFPSPQLKQPQSFGPSPFELANARGPLGSGSSQSANIADAEYPSFIDHLDRAEPFGETDNARRKGLEKPRHSQRRANRDEFDGPVQFLPKPTIESIAAQERELPHLPVNLNIDEQDEILHKVNDQLSQCAFDFMAKYEFPVPLEPDKRPIQKPGDREWTEWVYLIKRLATKRRIPARVLYNGQIKQLCTVLENSLEMRHASAHQSRPPKDDRNVLQLISAGIQVSKMFKDAVSMALLDRLYQDVEATIWERRQSTFAYHA